MFTLAAGDWGLSAGRLQPLLAREKVSRAQARAISRPRGVRAPLGDACRAPGRATCDATSAQCHPPARADRLPAVRDQKLRWEHVRDATLELPDGKNGARRVYLGPAAVNVLRSIERLPDNLKVITGERPGAHLPTCSGPWRRVRARAGLSDVRIHDLRHLFASDALAQRRKPGDDRQAVRPQASADNRAVRARRRRITAHGRRSRQHSDFSIIGGSVA